MAHGDAREGKWRGNWRMEWVASTLTLPRNVMYPALLPLMRTTRLPAVDWTDTPADLNGLVRFAERQNLVSARVPSRFKRAIPIQKSFRWRLDPVARPVPTHDTQKHRSLPSLELKPTIPVFEMRKATVISQFYHILRYFCERPSSILSQLQRIQLIIFLQ